jgi:serine/threonine-protein kinase
MRPPHDTPSQPDPPPAAGAAPPTLGTSPPPSDPSRAGTDASGLATPPLPEPVSCPTLRTSPPTAVLATRYSSPPKTDASGTATPPLPASAGRYQLGEEIGRGGMGTVLRARDPQLGRDLAVKVLRGDSHTDPESLRRFVEEAQVCGQLQHPSIVPVHDLGRLEDGRPFFAMKLVKGRTLADHLQERASPADDLPRYLAIFEAVCQAVAYAHSKGVIHRDLKPANVMVGAFGEVQVMDWGLAKVLRPQGGVTAPAAVTAASIVRTVRSAAGDETSHGQAMGTPAYMAPEQARGEVERLDERCDVFGLGAILCHVLTGQPPFTGGSPNEVHARAMRADLGGAFARLDGCGADAELVALAKACLAAEPEARPRDGGAVAVAVTAYRQAVQERLRRAELEKAAAEARAEAAKATAEAERRAAESENAAAAEARAAAAAERRARRRALALAAAVVGLTLAGGGWAWQRAQSAWRQEENNRLTETDLNEAARLLDAEQLPVCREALERAEGRLGGGGPADLRRRAEELRELLGVVRRLEQARLTRASGVREGDFDWASADEAYRKEFARYGLEGDNPDVEEVARRMGASPINGLLVAALDDWARIPLKPQRRWLLAIASSADTNDRRKRLREALARGDQAEAVLLAKEAESDRLPPSILLQLGDVPDRVVSADEAVRVLEAVQRRHPGEFWVNHELAYWLSKSRPGEAVGYFRAALAARPDSPGTYLNLGNALARKGRLDEAIAEYREALRIKPDYPDAHINLGNALRDQGRHKEAEAECREALRLNPNRSGAHSVLGSALADQGRLKEAEAEFREAIRLKKDYAYAHVSLGNALREQGRHKEAEAECREALRLNPNLSGAHSVLGSALADQGRLKEAEAEFREAIRLKADDPANHNNFGTALWGQRRLQEAEAEFREAVRLKPDFPYAHYAHNNLGNVLEGQGRLKEAEAARREAIRLKPDFPEAHKGLGSILTKERRLKEAEAEFRAALRLKPDFPEAHVGLGSALRHQGRPKEAEAACREAIRLKPDFPVAHFTLGNILQRQGWPKEAEATYREAIRLKPDFPEAHNNFGNALQAQGRPKEAEAEYREALRLKPDFPEAHGVHHNLGNVLVNQGKLREAEAEYREALRLKPDFPLAHGGLGRALRRQGRLDEALACYKRCHELGSKQPDWRYPSAQGVRETERFIALNRKLPAILKGREQPADAAECLALARFCVECKKLPRAAARLFTEAFATDPKLTADPRSSNRYNAACAAALAAAGQGEDAGKLTDEERARLRKRAFDWLRADLAAWAKVLEAAEPEARAIVRHQLQDWQKDPDLAGLRDKAALEKLPAAERDAWQRLWAEVDALLKRVREGTPVTGKAPTPSPGPPARPIRFVAEYLKIVARERCRTGVQDMRPWDRSRWSTGRQLFCEAQVSGYVELEAVCPEAGRYQLAVVLTRADDFGIVQVSLDGRKVGEPFDGFHSAVVPSGKIELGIVELSRGAHRVRFTAVGKNARSKNYYMGIDYLELRPVK